MKLIVVLVVAFAAVVSVFTGQFASSNEQFKMVFCYVGQGDGIYIRAFSNDIVIDGGPSRDSSVGKNERSIMECLSEHMPIFDRNIELMIVTHADSDHYVGFLDVLDTYTVTNFATSYGDSDVLGYIALLDKLESQNVEVRRLKQGDIIRINESLKFDVLWPPKEFTEIDSDRNNSSLVLLLDYLDFEVVLTGDLDKEYLNLLVNDLNHVEVFKLAHHGSYTGTDDQTFETFRPEISIISAGINSRFGHPHKEVIDVLNKFDLKYLSTQNGDIVIASDGHGFEVLR